MTSLWKESRNASSLENKYVFDGYASLRDFLDELADLSEKSGIYPNLSFGRDFASLVIYASGEALSDSERNFAEDIDRLYVKYQ